MEIGSWVFACSCCLCSGSDRLSQFRSGPNNGMQSWDPTLVNLCSWLQGSCNANNGITRLVWVPFDRCIHTCKNTRKEMSRVQGEESKSCFLKGPWELGLLSNLDYLLLEQFDRN